MSCTTPNSKHPTMNEIKKKIGFESAKLVEDGMLVGLGTGSTAKCFIDSLIQRCKEGLKITAVASSIASQKQAEEGGITVLDMDLVTKIDLTIDGADEIDPQKRLIKGGGGALLREKILAHASKEMVVIADEDKLVTKLGKFPLPVEITPFGANATIGAINDFGFKGTLRKDKNKNNFITDNSNLIFDIHFDSLIENPEAVHEKLISLPGVVETGFFFELTGRLLIGHKDGRVAFH